MSILCICESPGKIAKISKFLGKGVIVKASMGIFRDLDPHSMSIDFENNFSPIYIITKPDVVRNLKSAMHGVEMVYIASDKDLSGEKIAQDIYDVLKPKQYKRLIFTSITRDAILDSIKNASTIDKNKVSAEKTRRVLDRLYGYLISPILSRQIGGKLSAGRVQSVTTRLVIDRENEIKDFMSENGDHSTFKVYGTFTLSHKGRLSSGFSQNFTDLKCTREENCHGDFLISGTLHQSTDKDPNSIDDDAAYKGKVAQITLAKKADPNSIVLNLLKKCLRSTFTVRNITTREASRSPAQPFMTATLQEEANRKFGMSVDHTMKAAQKLYEAGAITYMRTDSVEISEQGHADIKKVIESTYGKEYYQRSNYKNKNTNAQEAHEAIRPTYPDRLSVADELTDPYQIKLYKLIWQRTIASQMKPAKLNITTIQIDISKCQDLQPLYYFQSQIEKVVFQGFMKVYVESVDDEDKIGIDDDKNDTFAGKIPKVGHTISFTEITARQEYSRPKPRYSEASLVKKLKELNIGRPSTYVNIIKTIKDREYVKICNVAGVKKPVSNFTIKTENGKCIKTIFEDSTSVLIGAEKAKMVPTELGITVNNFLIEHFPEMMDYNFTAKIETELDSIESGEKKWDSVVKKFYDKLNAVVIELGKMLRPATSDSGRLLGTDGTGTEIFAVRTKYGPAVKKDLNGKAIYAKISEPLTIETINLDDALKLFLYPKIIGKYRSTDIKLCKGPYGFYLSHGKTNYALTTDQAEKLDIEGAKSIINAKKENTMGEFTIKNGKTSTKTVILNGTYGPYISVTTGKQRRNYPIPRTIDPSNLTEAMVKDIISASTKPTKKSGSKTNNLVKKTSTKKSVAKKNSGKK